MGTEHWSLPIRLVRTVAPKPTRRISRLLIQKKFLARKSTENVGIDQNNEKIKEIEENFDKIKGQSIN